MLYLTLLSSQTNLSNITCTNERMQSNIPIKQNGCGYCLSKAFVKIIPSSPWRGTINTTTL